VTINLEFTTKSSYVLVAGFAQLPKGTPIYEIQKTIGCVLIIDKDTDVIVEASFTFIMDVTNEFISSLIRGKSIKNGIDQIIHQIKTRFLVPPQRAVIQALLSAYDRYREMKE
jgi:hypothetical protein